MKKHYLPNRKMHLKEDEPPNEHLVTDGDLFIRHLAEKQTLKTTTLSEQLNIQQDFDPSSSSTYIPLTEFTSGQSTLKQFQVIQAQCDQITQFKSDTKDDLQRNCTRRLQTECITAAKPHSFETKAFKTYLDKIQYKNSNLTASTDEMKLIENSLDAKLNHSTTNLQTNIRKIRRKARNLNRKIISHSVVSNDTIIIPSKKFIKHSDVRNIAHTSKWDVKQLVANTKNNPILKKCQKQITCKPQNLYTIQNGQIIKLDDLNKHDQKLSKDQSVESVQISIEDIRKLPKFQNYNMGTPTSDLFVKNLHKSIKTDEDLLQIFHRNHEVKPISVKLLRGKMHGQAFVKFTDVGTAKKALTAINGTFIETKPIIIEYKKLAS